jgi:signal transduction histidine kinase
VELTPIILVTITANLALGVCSAATLLIAFWLGLKQLINRQLALTMLLLLGYGGLSQLVWLGELLEIPPRIILYLSNCAGLFASVALAVFCLAYGGSPARQFRWLAFCGTVQAMVISAFIWADWVFIDIVQPRNAPIAYSTTILAAISAIFLIAYQVYVIRAVRRLPAKRAETLWKVLLIPLFAGVIDTIPGLAVWPWLPTAALIVTLIIGRMVLREQVIIPLVSLNRDLTKANEQIEKANHRKSQFLAMMSHELRTPLNSIINYAEMSLAMNYGPLNDQQLDRLEKVMRNGRQLLALINDVLDLSKIEVGRLELKPTPIYFPTCLDKTLETFGPLAKMKNLRLNFDIPSKLPPILADPERFDQIMVNLVSNAVRFTMEGAITIQVRHDKKDVVISVSDTGKGIPPERHAHLFDTTQSNIPSQVDTNSVSTGLGLTLTRQLVQLHGGRIWVKSTGIEGEGSTFSFTMPIAE